MNTLGTCQGFGSKEYIAKVVTVIPQDHFSWTATFSVQAAHADGAGELEALLADEPNAALNGVDRVVAASLVVATVAGILEEHRTGGAEIAMALTNFGEEAGDRKGGGRGKRGQASNPTSVKENDGGVWQLFFRILEK